MYALVPISATAAPGVVTRIAAVHCRYAPRPGSDSHISYPVPVLVSLLTSSRQTDGLPIAAMSDSSATSSSLNSKGRARGCGAGRERLSRCADTGCSGSNGPWNSLQVMSAVPASCVIWSMLAGGRST
jgi:hypothetical protein